jgi:hypothetical protein
MEERMNRSARRWVVVFGVSAIMSIAGCNGNQGRVTPITTAVTPAVMTMGKVQSDGTLPENSCNNLLANAPTPLDWWNGLRPGQPPKAAGEGAVGFEIEFATTGTGTGTCSQYRQQLYRTGFSYDLSQLQNLKGLVTKAQLSFSSFILPSGVSTIGLCQPVTGGGGSLLILGQGASLPSAVGGFADLGGGVTGLPFPASGRVFGMTFPWVPGTITSGLASGVTVTTLASGLGGAGFSVDVTSFLNGALNRGAASLAFMISGSDESTPTVFPAGPTDCKTVYKVDNLMIEHL